MTLVWRPGFAYDTDASAYIDAVEVADGQALETATRYAINDFVIGCKQDGIWSAIKASCILSGARTLAGALVPLAGTAPTNFNFVSGDYNRVTGLVGDGATKYLDSNRAGNADLQDSMHQSVFATVLGAGGGRVYISDRDPATSAGSSFISYVSSLSLLTFNSRGGGNVTAITTATGFMGHSRTGSSAGESRVGGSTTAFSTPSGASPLSTHKVFVAGNLASHNNGRLAFYSIGESLDLTALDTRVSTLIAQFGAVIP